MGLLSTEVEVTLGSTNIGYYENLGYKIPRTEKIYYNKNGKISNKTFTVTKGTKMNVMVKDLQKNSTVKVNVECDECHKKYELAYYNYNNRNHCGKIYCNDCAHKVLLSGENHHNWNSNKTDKERKIKRHYAEYTEFVKKVLARDNYTCVITGKTSKETELEVHHLNSYDWYIEGRTDITNAITISKDLHRAFHTKYGHGKNTKQQFIEFIGNINLFLKEYNGKIPTARLVYCIEENKIYSSVDEFSQEKNINKSSVRNTLNRKYRSIKMNEHILWYDEYIKMSKEEIKEYINWCNKPRSYDYLIGIKPNNKPKKTVCITTGEIFDSINLSSSKYNIRASSISAVCKNKRNHAGKLSDGTPLKWMYYEDFLKLPQEEQNEILARNQESSSDDSFIM